MTATMTATTHPYTPEHHTIGTMRDGRVIALAPMTAAAAATLAPQIAAIGPWAHYNFQPETLHKAFLTSGDGAVRYQLLIGDMPAGAVIIRSPWLAGPYLQMLALLPAHQGSGIGKLFLDWYEATAHAAGLRNVWLCVTGVNTNAQRLYLRHGYTLVGRLADVIRDGDDELLMRKTLIGRNRASTPA